MKIPDEIKVLIDKAKCPQCNSRLIFGGWQQFFEYYDLDTLEKDYGKDRSEGHALQCPENYNHNIAGVLTCDDEEELKHWLMDNI